MIFVQHHPYLPEQCKKSNALLHTTPKVRVKCKRTFGRQSERPSQSPRQRNRVPDHGGTKERASDREGFVCESYVCSIHIQNGAVNNTIIGYDGKDCERTPSRNKQPSTPNRRPCSSSPSSSPVHHEFPPTDQLALSTVNGCMDAYHVVPVSTCDSSKKDVERTFAGIIHVRRHLPAGWVCAALDYADAE